MLSARWSIALFPLLAASAGYPRSGWAQRIQLELRPRVGDTVRMRLDQVTQMSGARKGSASKQVLTTLRMFSRAIVESSDPAASVILAVTDSIDVYTSDEHARTLTRDAKRQLEGRQMRLRLAPDGTVGLAEQRTSVPREVNDLVSVMPASFPRNAVAVGDTWVREMPIPQGTRFGVPMGGVVRARFRLDSVTRSGDMAHVSMRGILEPASKLTVQQGTIGGTVHGNLVVNRRRGWLSESRFYVDMRATFATVGDATAAPMQFQMKITQHMRTSDKRP
jgi:hypothetical protein